MRTVAWVRGIGRLTGAELHAAYVAASRIGTYVDNLIGVESFESGLNPAARNAQSGATGVIQFMKNTAVSLGTTTDALAKMTFTEQQEYAVRYFAWFKGPLDTLEKLYCAVFWPAAIHKPDDYVIAVDGAPAYRQNMIFDRLGNKDGRITRAEICKAVRGILEEAKSKPRIEIPDPDASPFTRAELAEIAALQTRIAEDTTEEFRKDRPAWLESEDDDDTPPTDRNS